MEISLTIFSYISITSSDDIVVNFTTFSETAKEGIRSLLKINNVCQYIPAGRNQTLLCFNSGIPI